MDILEETDVFLSACQLTQDESNNLVFNGITGCFESKYLADWFVNQINFGWKLWQEAKAKAVPEGFVLVPKENISCFWQDNDEPENFCNSSNDWDCLGDGIEKDQIMIVNKHTQAHISTEKFFGVWKLIETSYGTRWKFELFKSEFEAKQAMIEAQEPAND